MTRVPAGRVSRVCESQSRQWRPAGLDTGV